MSSDAARIRITFGADDNEIIIDLTFNLLNSHLAISNAQLSNLIVQTCESCRVQFIEIQPKLN